MSVKSEACVPAILTLGVPVRFRVTEPLLLMVKVLPFVPLLISSEPKSVSSPTLGVLSSSTIEVELAEISISADGGTCLIG